MKIFKKIFLLVTTFLVATPIASAQYIMQPGRGCSTSVSNVGDFFCRVSEIFDMIVPLLIGLGVIIFIWGVIQYVIGDDEEAKKKGKDRIVFGIIGFTVIIGLWGLVGIVRDTFDLDGSNSVIPGGVSTQVVGTSDSTCEGNNVNNIEQLICKVSNILKSIVPLLISLGVIIFIWGVIQYVIGDDEEAKKKGRDRIIFGILGLVVIVGMWGLVNIITNTFGIGGNNQAVITEFTQNNNFDMCSGDNASLGNNPTVSTLLNFVTCTITKSIIPLLLSLAVLMFVWGVVQYVISAGNEEKIEQGKQFMIWGLIGLTVMVSVWGIVKIFGDTIGVEHVIPQVNTTN